MAQGDGPLDKPFLTVFAPPENKRNGTAMIVAPGGSNIMLMYGAEGVDIAEKLNDWGITAFVLTYRLSPKYNAAARTLDGKRAIPLVRAHASEWKLDPKRVGISGYSAGSEIARAMPSTAADANSADPIDRENPKPDYLVLVYSVGRPAQGEQLKDFPPTFLLSAAADRGPTMGNVQLFQDMMKAGANPELHIYQKGRHGFGAAYGSSEFGDWMSRLQGWMKVGGFLPEGK
jgi:acetyl esterase/lipase